MPSKQQVEAWRALAEVMPVSNAREGMLAMADMLTWAMGELDERQLLHDHEYGTYCPTCDVRWEGGCFIHAADCETARRLAEWRGEVEP
jgi:hypothetical protein